MKKLISLFILLMFLFLCWSSVSASMKMELPDYIRNQLHDDIKYTVITERNLLMLDALLENAKSRHFIVIQTRDGSLTQDHVNKILTWVSQGGVMWFYDSRQAHFFGMKNSPLKESSMKGQTHVGGFGTTSVPGFNVVAQVYPFAEHPVASGVHSVQLFLMQVGENLYSAVEDSGNGVIPVFRVNLEPRAVVALRKHGKGWVVFKPLLWPDVLGGERFQVNLKEFSAGYPVPKGEKPVISPEAFKGKPQQLPRYDSVYLSDGQQVIGMITEQSLDFMGGDGNIKASVNEIESIKFTSVSHTLSFKDGRQLQGLLINRTLKFKTPTGKVLEISRENITGITFNVGGGK
jgi:hypothetical protein